jgi:hypothetical protein
MKFLYFSLNLRLEGCGINPFYVKQLIHLQEKLGYKVGAFISGNRLRAA